MLRAVGGVIARRASAHVQQGTVRASFGASVNRFKSTTAEVTKDEQVGVAEPVGEAAPTSEVAAPKRGSNHRKILPLDNDEIRPWCAPDTYISPSATVIGYAQVNHYSCIMNNCVLRGDLACIYVGAFSVVEDDCVFVAGSVANPSADVTVDDYVEIGSGTVLRSCTVQSRCVIGSGTVIEENAFVSENCVIEPRSVVPAGTEIPSGQVWGGNPAVFKGYVDKFDIAERDTIMAKTTTTLRHKYQPMFLPYSTAWVEKQQFEEEGQI